MHCLTLWLDWLWWRTARLQCPLSAVCSSALWAGPRWWSISAWSSGPYNSWTSASVSDLSNRCFLSPNQPLRLWVSWSLDTAKGSEGRKELSEVQSHCTTHCIYYKYMVTVGIKNKRGGKIEIQRNKNTQKKYKSPYRFSGAYWRRGWTGGQAITCSRLCERVVRVGNTYRWWQQSLCHGLSVMINGHKVTEDS